MTNTLATITISQQDELKFLAVLDELAIGCNCHSAPTKWHGECVARYTLDIAAESLNQIRQHIDFICITTTHYTTTQPFGLRVINPH